MARKCIVCRERPAAVPDRNKGGIGRPIKEVCRECHAGRLVDDLQHCLDVHQKDQAKKYG